MNTLKLIYGVRKWSIRLMECHSLCRWSAIRLSVLKKYFFIGTFTRFVYFYMKKGIGFVQGNKLAVPGTHCGPLLWFGVAGLSEMCVLWPNCGESSFGKGGGGNSKVFGWIVWAEMNLFDFGNENCFLAGKLFGLIRIWRWGYNLLDLHEFFVC